ncbi:MAG: pyridoxamine 5'-phosphate oxidase family protein [Anaerolineae bacterium]|nr:pyridoxamine 5'-phosphate oxidase family protein [Anaerolineae bacterium]
MARRVSSGIDAAIHAVFQDFIHEQRLAVLASVDAEGRAWASLVTGAPGFMRVEDDHTVHLNTVISDLDVLRSNLSINLMLGMLVIDFSTRRRIRLNGTGHLDDDGTLRLTTQEVYGNCQKYIQARTELPLRPADVPTTPTLTITTSLNASQQRWLSQADTFFIASYMPSRGADASHRGGQPGFVHVLDDHTLEFPDYAGNMMFNTLGNLAANPRAGILLLDFDTGSVLQLTGHVIIHWEPASLQRHLGSQRVIEFRIAEVREITHAVPLRFKFLSYSKFNPTT